MPEEHVDAWLDLVLVMNSGAADARPAAPGHRRHGHHVRTGNPDTDDAMLGINRAMATGRSSRR